MRSISAVSFSLKRDMMENRGASQVNTSKASVPAPRNLTGALWLVLSGISLTVFLVLAKQLSASQEPAILAFWRSFVGLFLVLPIILRRGWGIFRITRPGLVILRSLLGTAAFICSMYAISDAFALPLSQFNAISFSRALFVTLLAPGFLKKTSANGAGRHCSLASLASW